MVSDLVGVVVADDAFVLGEAQLATLICGQSEGGQEARSQRVDWGVVISNCSNTKQNDCSHTTYQYSVYIWTV